MGICKVKVLLFTSVKRAMLSLTYRLLGLHLNCSLLTMSIHHFQLHSHRRLHLLSTQTHSEKQFHAMSS